LRQPLFVFRALYINIWPAIQQLGRGSMTFSKAYAFNFYYGNGKSIFKKEQTLIAVMKIIFSKSRPCSVSGVALALL
jgi:hypothetical protein